MSSDIKVSVEIIERSILLIRGHKVMLDKDLAVLYGVGTRDLNKAVGRNIERFPADFMFRLSKGEIEDLMFRFGTSRWGGTRKPPCVFTEQGVAMLSSVLRSKKAIQVNIVIMRAFVKLRGIMAANKEFAHKLKELEGRIERNEIDIESVFTAIRQLMEPSPEKPKRRSGFRAG